MIRVDAHCDTITKIIDTRSTLYKNNCHIDIERLSKSPKHVQFFAAFIHPTYVGAEAVKRAIQIINALYREIESNSDKIALCKNFDDIIESVNLSKISAILSIEGGSALGGDIGMLKTYKMLGVRSICLTWNYKNEIASGILDEEPDTGLTDFGIDVINEMNRLNIIIDVSHISEKSFWDVLETTKQPVTASHSNSRKLCSHKRNLSDEQILALKKNNGIMGINFYPDFLNISGKATIKDIISHIEHVMALTGHKHVGIGADFDGVDYLPQGISGVQDMDKIFEELLKLNYPEEWVRAIAGENFLRMLEINE